MTKFEPPKLSWNPWLGLIIFLVPTAYLAVEGWSGNAKQWNYLVAGATCTLWQAALLLGSRLGWKDTVLHQVVGALFVAGFLLGLLLNFLFPR
jgi:hypothetical protein